MNNLWKKLILSIAAIIMCLIFLLNGSLNISEAKNIFEYISENVDEGFEIISVSDKGYVLLEKINDDGSCIWKIRSSKYLETTLEFPYKYNEYIAFTDEYLLTMEMYDTDEENLFFSVYIMNPGLNGSSHRRISTFPKDKFNDFPFVEEVHIYGNEVLFKLRYYESKDKLSKQYKMYHLDLDEQENVI